MEKNIGQMISDLINASGDIFAYRKYEATNDAVKLLMQVAGRNIDGAILLLQAVDEIEYNEREENGK